MDGGECLERRDPLVLGLADADEDAARERDLQLARGADRLKAPGRVLRRRPRVDGLHQSLADRFEHQSLRGRHLAQPTQVRVAQDAEVRVGKQPALERALARPDDVRGEVLVPVLGQARRDDGVDLGLLTREDEQFLGAPAQREVELFLDLLRRVEVRLVRRERAVLAVALAPPRQRQREVPGERDTAAHRSAGAYRCAAAGPPAAGRGPDVIRGQRGASRPLSSSSISRSSSRAGVMPASSSSPAYSHSSRPAPNSAPTIGPSV